MTNREAIKLAKRVEAWQKRLNSLGIAHWRIECVSIVDPSGMPDSPTADATVQPSHKYDTCRFWFSSDFLDEADERKLDEIIVHEWVHVAMRDLDLAIESVEDQLAPAVHETWEDRVVHEREGFVDRIARQIYAFYSESI